MIYLSNRGYFHIFLSNILYLNLLDIVKNYLIKIWISGTSDFVGQINWTTDKKAEDFCNEITESLHKIYGEHLKKLVIDNNENLPDENFGTLGYFRTRMQNQIDNIGAGFSMAKNYSYNNNFDYDVVVRCRPDNSMFPRPLTLSAIKYHNDVIYSTVFTPSGHRDLCFFAMSNPYTFEKYCSFKYLHGEDPDRTDNNFTCTEHMWENYLKSIGVRTKYIPDICRPFTGFDKTRPISDFPYRNENEMLIDAEGNFVKQVLS